MWFLILVSFVDDENGTLRGHFWYLRNAFVCEAEKYNTNRATSKKMLCGGSGELRSLRRPVLQPIVFIKRIIGHVCHHLVDQLTS